MIRWPEEEIGRNSVSPWTTPSSRRLEVRHRGASYADATPLGALDSRPVKRTAAALLSIWALMLLVAPAALADEGVGLAGPTTDKTVTFFCFGVIFFFAALVIVLSLIQNRLDKRKEQRRSDLARFN